MYFRLVWGVKRENLPNDYELESLDLEEFEANVESSQNGDDALEIVGATICPELMLVGEGMHHQSMDFEKFDNTRDRVRMALQESGVTVEPELFIVSSVV